MRRITVGIVDYGVGNHASVWRSLHILGFRSRVSGEAQLLNQTDLLLLPGVGAFPAAMAALANRGLVEYLQQRARDRHPILGICLGMQLLCDVSYEHRLTAGLGLIPGEVVTLEKPKWHIGWNSLELVRDDPLLRSSDRHSFYFNHSYVVRCPEEYQICIARDAAPFPVVVRRGNVLGLQFHPEKSQSAGRALLKTAVEGLVRA